MKYMSELNYVDLVDWFGKCKLYWQNDYDCEKKTYYVIINNNKME